MLKAHYSWFLLHPPAFIQVFPFLGTLQERGLLPILLLPDAADRLPRPFFFFFSPTSPPHLFQLHQHPRISHFRSVPPPPPLGNWIQLEKKEKEKKRGKTCVVADSFLFSCFFTSPTPSFVSKEIGGGGPNAGSICPSRQTRAFGRFHIFTRNVNLFF